MRSPATLVALCLLTACDGNATAPFEDAKHLGESTANLLIALRGRGELAHTADQTGANSCSTILPNPEKADCQRTFALNTVVTLQPKAGAGYAFDHWGGACTGKGVCTVTMSEKRVLEAIFKPVVAAPTAYTLKIAVRGRGEVKHTPDLTGATSCLAQQSTADRADCARAFAPGTEVVLEAQPAAGFKFVGWAGPCSGFGVCSLKMNESRALEVKFQG